MYFAGLNKGKGSIEGLKNAQNVAKQSTIGLTIAQTALNMAISMGLMAAISLAIKGFDKLVNSAKRASEAANEAFSDTNEKVQQNEEEAKSLDGLISKYKELKESGNLDIDGRKEVKELQNDIADLVGTQAKNLDLVNGKLDEEIEKLNKISAKEAKDAYETATANYFNSQKANKNAAGDDSYVFFDGYAYVGKKEKEPIKILQDAGFNNAVQTGGLNPFNQQVFVMDTFDNDFKELKGAQEKADYLQSMIDVLEQNGQRATDLYAGLIRQRDDYLTYLDNQQSAANSLVNSWLTYSQFSNEELSKINVDSVESFEDYRQKMLDEAKKDESIGKVLADGTLSNEDLENAINDFMATSLNFSTWYEQWINNVQSSTSSELFSSFDNTNLGERLQHANKLFKEGELTHKQYFDSLQNEIDNFDASNFTDSLEDANKASQQFFTDSVQQSASGLSDLINKFDAGKMSVSEYLDGYLAIGETLSTLADNLQENSSAWDKNGEAMSNAVSSGLDSIQSDLDNAMSTITGYQDSIYSLEQIMTGAVKAGSDEFTAHANVIAQDLANIVASGGEMASEVANTLGTTTSEIASNLTKNVSNQSLAAQTIAANTNIAISDMATSVANIFTTLGNAISNFNVDISFSKTSGSLNDAITGNGELKFNLSASGETLSTIGDAISAFGETLVLNIQPQLIEAPDFSLDADEYTPDVDTLKNYNDELDRLKDSSKGASDATDALTDSLKKQKEVLEGQKEEYEALHGAIINYIDGEIDKIDDKIDAINEENEALEKQLDIYDDIISAVTDNIDAEIDAIDEKIEKLQDANSEEEKALKLEEAKRKLAEAKSRKTVLQYEAGKGFVYHNDENAISEAHSELEALQEEAVIDALEKEKQLLEENKQKWLDITDARKKALKAALARDYFGDDWQTTTLNPSDEMLKNLSDDYIGTQIQIEENDALIEELNKEKDFWENEKELWQDALDEWGGIQDEARLKAFFGSDYEYQLLHNSATWRRQFADEYSSVCSEIESLEERIKSASEETASSVASNAEKAGGSLKTVSDGLSEVKTKVEETGNISEYLWSDADETALSSAREQLKLMNELIDSGATELIDARDNLANFVLEYDGLKHSREVSDELTDSIKTLGSSLSDADSGIGELISGVSDRLANYEQTSSTLAQNTQTTAENLGKVNEEINNLQTSEETIESEASQTVSEVETTVTNLVTKLDTLKTALGEIKFSTDEVENVVDEELLDTSEVVDGVHTKVTEIQTAITTLTETITPLQGALESLLETMGKLDEVTLSKVIGQFGGVSGTGEGNEGLNTPSTGNISAVGEESSGASGLLGAIKAVDEAIGESSDGEGGTGLLGKLSQVDSTTLEKIIAQFGLGGENPEGGESSEGSLLSAVNAVSDAIIGGKDDDKSLIGSLKKLSEESTLENVTTVTDSFTDLLTQIQTCIDKIGELAEAITNLPSLPNGGGNGGSGGGSIAPNAKGGIITKKSAGDFDYIAKAVGEDHTIAVKEGEAVIPKESVDQNPELVQSLIDGGLEPIDNKSIITDDGRTLIPYNPFPNVDFTKLMTPIIPDLPFTKFAMDSRNVKKMEQSTTVEFHGDIIVQGVQDADGFAKDIKYRLANIMTQELNKR